MANFDTDVEAKVGVVAKTGYKQMYLILVHVFKVTSLHRKMYIFLA